MILQRLTLQELPGSIPDLFDARLDNDRGQVVHTHVNLLSDDVQLERSGVTPIVSHTDSMVYILLPGSELTEGRKE